MYSQRPLRSLTRRLLVAAAVLPLTIGDAHAKEKPVAFNREAKLYRLPGGNVFTAKYQQGKKAVGPVQIDISAQQVLTGVYTAVKNGDKRWGQLFWTVAGDSANINVKGLQRGTISAQGGGVSMQCEYVTTASRQGGYGFCKDSTDNLYRLMF